MSLMTESLTNESLLTGGPGRRPARHRAHSLRPGPGRDHPSAAAETDHASGHASGHASAHDLHTSTHDLAAWDEPGWDDEEAVLSGPDLAPAPAAVRTPTFAPRPAALPCEAPAVPPRRTVGPFPPIRAGGRHRLPSAVRRRSGPIAAGLMVAATTLAAGSLRGIPAPPPGHPAAAAAPPHVEVVDNPPQE
ncbi:hypothetical protein [Streptacidiphilus carbonis]|uniref:hypothetical protein n=1 Tax=Streptacidiphilus carbonis TaxID=105422 RepID=UPI000693529D|nr:hypothetical protein [Streptacidiphilus carbonis]